MTKALPKALDTDEYNKLLYRGEEPYSPEVWRSLKRHELYNDGIYVPEDKEPFDELNWHVADYVKARDNGYLGTPSDEIEHWLQNNKDRIHYPKVRDLRQITGSEKNAKEFILGMTFGADNYANANPKIRDAINRMPNWYDIIGKLPESMATLPQQGEDASTWLSGLWLTEDKTLIGQGKKPKNFERLLPEMNLITPQMTPEDATYFANFITAMGGNPDYKMPVSSLMVLSDLFITNRIPRELFDTAFANSGEALRSLKRRELWNKGIYVPEDK